MVYPISSIGKTQLKTFPVHEEYVQWGEHLPIQLSTPSDDTDRTYLTK